MANKLKLIPKAQRGAVIPNGRETLPAGLTLEQYLNAKDQLMKLYGASEMNPIYGSRKGDDTIEQAVNFIGRQAPAAAPTTPTQPSATVQTPQSNSNLLNSFKLIAPKFAELKGTDAAPIQARPGGNQENDIQREARLRAQNSELGRFFTH